MSNRKKVVHGEHQSKTRKSNTAWSDAAIVRNVKLMRETISEFKGLLKQGVTFYKNTLRFPKKMGFPIDEVNVQEGNSKLNGHIYSVSLPPVLYCKNCKACKNDCYDLRHDVTQPQCRLYRAANAAIYETDPEHYFESISRQAKAIRWMRWHIGGDIVDMAYLQGMVRVANDNPHCRFMAFTKMFDVVNEWLDHCVRLPDNLQIIFSAWPGLELKNPHRLPVAFPVFAEGDEDEFMAAMPSWYWHCGNDCTECALCGQGCWTLKRGEAVGFPLH